MTSRSKLHISDDLSLPTEIVTQTFGILAQRRKGKTYTASVMAEEMVDCGIPWVALDPTGAWWGLRAMEDGTEGLDVLVIGGQHGQLPLDRQSGKVMADLVVEHPGWYVFDLSAFESKEAERQFATDFAERLYRRKAKDSSPLHLFIDEAEVFVPQRTPRGDQRMLGAFEALVKRGGIRGIGVTLISQRAASVNKNVLEQIDDLIVLRVVGPNDRKAILGYIEAYGTEEEKRTLMDSLASLKLGEAWVWEPGAEPPLFERVTIRKRHTYNSSATGGQKKVEPRKLSKVDVDKLRDRIEETIEKAKQEDPKELRREIADLKKKLAQAPKEQPAPEPEEIEVPVFPPELRKEIEHQLNVARSGAQQFAEWAEDWIDRLKEDYGFDLGPAPVAQTVARQQPQQQPKPPKQDLGEIEPLSPLPNPPADTELSKSGLKMLTTLVQRWPMKLSRSQMATLSGYSLKSSTIPGALTNMRNAGVIEEGDGLIWPSETGFALLGASVPPAASRDELIADFRRALPTAACEFFDALVAAWPNDLTRDELVERTSYSATSSTVPAALTTLRKNGLMDEDSGRMSLSETIANA